MLSGIWTGRNIHQVLSMMGHGPWHYLGYVSLILQTMAKTFKMLPVMLVGMVISRKRHSLREVCVATGHFEVHGFQCFGGFCLK